MGHIGDVAENNIVHDAATTHGSSSGPVLNASGEVVALNYALLEEFTGGRDMQQHETAARANRLGIRSLPAVVVDGKLAGCCAGRGPAEQVLREALR